MHGNWREDQQGGGRLDKKWEVTDAVRQVDRTGDGAAERITRLVPGEGLCPEEPQPPAASRLLPVPLTEKKIAHINLISFSAPLCTLVSQGTGTEHARAAARLSAREQPGALLHAGR